MQNDSSSDKDKRGTPRVRGAEGGVRPKENISRRASTKPQATDSLTCHICLNIFTQENAMLIYCERCEAWFCAKCLKMSKTTYQVLTQKKNAHWFCDPCQEPAMTAVVSDKHIEDRCEQYLQGISTRIDTLEIETANKASHEDMEGINARVQVIEHLIQTKAEVSEVENLTAKIDNLQLAPGEGASQKLEQMTLKINALQDKVQAMDINAAVGQSEGGRAQVREVARTSVYEVQDRTWRCKNVIMYNVPESNQGEPAQRMAEDRQSVMDICQHIELTPQPQKVMRLGKKREQQTRPLRVALPAVEDQKELLAKAKNLKNAEDTVSKNCYIRRDMTRMEIEEDKKLVALRKTRRQESEEKGDKEAVWIIRKGKVINLSQKTRPM